VILLAEGDSVTRPMDALGGRSVVQLFLDNGIVPVVRFKVLLNRGWPVMDHVRELVRQFAAYGLTPLVLIGNEPGDGREWAGDGTPKDWDLRYLDYYMKHGSGVVSEGGVALFADGPSWPYDFFPSIEPVWHHWEAGWMGFAGHWYGLNRPPDFPYDSVTQLGSPLLTEKDIEQWFGPFLSDRGLNDVPLEMVNAARKAGKQPGLTAIVDDTCWRGWERVAFYMQRHFGKVLYLCMTEGGWTPGAVAGSGENRDLRFLRPTPDTVAVWTEHVVNRISTPVRWYGFWLGLDSCGGGSGAWDGDSWATGSWRHGGPSYWLEMPVIRILQNNPPPDEPAPSQTSMLWGGVKTQVKQLRRIVR